MRDDDGERGGGGAGGGHVDDLVGDDGHRRRLDEVRELLRRVRGHGEHGHEARRILVQVRDVGGRRLDAGVREVGQCRALPVVPDGLQDGGRSGRGEGEDAHHHDGLVLAIDSEMPLELGGILWQTAINIGFFP